MNEKGGLLHFLPIAQSSHKANAIQMMHGLSSLKAYSIFSSIEEPPRRVKCNPSCFQINMTHVSCAYLTVYMAFSHIY